MKITQKEIGEYLLEIGFNPSYKGFYCLGIAIQYCLNLTDEELQKVHVVRDVYEYVSAHVHQSTRSVEHCIRNSIENLFDTNAANVFENIASFKSGKVSNKTCIVYLTMKLRNKYNV